MLVTPAARWGHPTLDIKRTTHRVHDAAKVSQHPVAGVLDNPSTVLRDFRIDK